MNTSNIISTPNITGNIGSCSIQSNEITVRNNLLTREHQVTQINSCTGKIISVNSYTTYEGSIIAGMMIAIVIVMITGFLSSNNDTLFN